VAALARGFVAVFPPAPVLDALDARTAPVRAAESRLRWARREHWHCTLRFLGWVPDVDAVVAGLRSAAASVPPVAAVALCRGGAFPKPRHGSVLWVGVSPPDALDAIAAAVERVCVGAGFAPEDRPFRAHVTVARSTRARDLRAAVQALGAEVVGPLWPVTEIALVASDTRPEGAVYDVIARFPLDGEAGSAWDGE
jgi:2'-5' RNA ligase